MQSYHVSLDFHQLGISNQIYICDCFFQSVFGFFHPLRIISILINSLQQNFNLIAQLFIWIGNRCCFHFQGFFGLFRNNQRNLQWYFGKMQKISNTMSKRSYLSYLFFSNSEIDVSNFCRMELAFVYTEKKYINSKFEHLSSGFLDVKVFFLFANVCAIGSYCLIESQTRTAWSEGGHSFYNISEETLNFCFAIWIKVLLRNSCGKVKHLYTLPVSK